MTSFLTMYIFSFSNVSSSTNMMYGKLNANALPKNVNSILRLGIIGKELHCSFEFGQWWWEIFDPRQIIDFIDEIFNYSAYFWENGETTLNSFSAMLWKEKRYFDIIFECENSSERVLLFFLHQSYREFNFFFSQQTASKNARLRKCVTVINFQLEWC